MKLKVIEMFAGVGGFRVGLSRASSEFDFVWANQWEPSSKKQIAWQCYEKNFGSNSCVNKNISQVDVAEIPDFDLLTAGFPCQDYSVAKSLKYSSGIEGKKGVLWWDIERVLKSKHPRFVLLENVDRLLISPAKQRGRDFAIILACLMNLGYHVEWRVINAANFGMPQKRKRIFIWAMKENFIPVLAQSFPGYSTSDKKFTMSRDILEVSNEFGKDAGQGFFNYGHAHDFAIETHKVVDNFNGPMQVLKDVVQQHHEVPAHFHISEQELQAWKPFKLGRRIERISKTGHSYIYSEGKMAFPDSLNKPARTIITAEGGSTPSRFKHVVLCETPAGLVYRRLTPIELERVNMFPDNHTAGYTDVQRAFLMGNALVTGIITRIGQTLMAHLGQEEKASTTENTVLAPMELIQLAPSS